MSRSTALRDALLVKPGSRFRLAKLDQDETFGYDKASAAPVIEEQTRPHGRAPGPLLGGVEAIHARRPAGHRCGRQGRHHPEGHGGVQPAGLRRSRRSRCRPRRSSAHDFLWRIHKRTPGKGEIGIFNRSHYEDVLVVRVHGLVPKSVWSKRYDQINDFERIARGERHDDRQVLPVDRPRRAAQAVPGALRRPDQALEVLARRPRGAQALGRLPGGLRRHAVEDIDRCGAVVRHPGQPKLAAEPGRLDDPRRHAGGV